MLSKQERRKIKRITLTLIIYMIVIFIVSCNNDNYESISNNILNTLDKISKIITNITDESSADNSIEKLKILSNKMEDLKLKLDKIGNVNDELKINYNNKLEKSKNNFIKACYGISLNQYGAKVLKTVNQVLNKIQ